MKTFITYLAIFSFCLLKHAYAQFEFRLEGAPDTNFYDIRQAYLENWSGSGHDESEGGEFNQFIRWNNFWSLRLSPSGSFQIAGDAVRNYVQSFDPTSKFQSTINSNWTELGPAINGITGVGQIKAIAFDPDNPENIMYAGAPVGGVWKTVNGGLDWFNLNTDHQFARLGASYIAIDKVQNSNGIYNIYVATGDVGSLNSFSDGIYRSIDGGVTWHTMNNGLFNASNSFNYIAKLLIDDSNADIMYAATSVGIYKTVNRQDVNPTWIKVYPNIGNEWMRNIEFEPGSSTTLFASGVDFIKSVSSGTINSWTSIGTASNGLNMAGTPNFIGNLTHPFFADKYIQNTNFSISSDNLYLYAIVYFRNTSPPWNFSIPGGRRAFKYDIVNDTWSAITSVDCYRMPIKVSPFNNSLVFVGDVYLNRTINGGVNWLNVGGNIHDDFHAIEFAPYDDHVLFVGCDGGIWKIVLDQSGNVISRTELNNGLSVATIYNTASSVFDPYQILIGNQDLGLNYFKNSLWSHKITSDGFEVLMDHNNINIMYGTTYWPVNGKINRSINNAANPYFNCCYNVSSEPAIHGAALVMDPYDSNILLQGRINVWKTNNASTTMNWTKISDFQNNHNATLYQAIKALVVAPQDPNYIYTNIIEDLWATGTFNRLFKSTVGGGTGINDWIEITPTPGINNPISAIAVSDKDPNHIWVTYSGYNSNLKVKESFDGGNNWIDVNSGLPNLPVNCIIYERGTNDGIYIGTDVGVYYKNAYLTSWVPFMTDLPNTVVSWLEINYSANKIRAATYGRGLWESNLACPSPYLFLTGTLLSSTEEAEIVDISNASINSGIKIHIRGTEEISIEPTSGPVEFAYGSHADLYIHNCEIPGNSWRLSPENYNVNQVSNNDYKIPTNIVNTVRLFPNPACRVLKIMIEGSDKLFAKNVEIFDISGKIVNERVRFDSQFSEIQLSDLTDGIYFIKITINSKIYYSKFVKQQ